MDKPPKSEVEESVYEKDSTEEELLPPDVSHEPAAGDPVKEALAMAEAVAPGPSEHLANKPSGEKEINESTSLMQVIDQVEQRLRPSLEPSDSQSLSLPEELDALDIEADLGRPDEPVEASGISQPPPSLTDKSVDEYESEKEDKQEEEQGLGSTEIHGASRHDTDMAQQPGLCFENGFRRSGELDDDPLWTLLLAALVDRLTGVLTLDDSGQDRKLFIEKGDVIMATSTAREDRLVELLYREGRLSDEEYSQAVLAVGASGRRVGAILVERGLISSKELFPLVRHHYESIILDSFAWRQGTWQFEAVKELGKERILLDVSSPTLIVEGIRSRARPEDINELVPSKSQPFETPEGICKIEDIGLLPEEIAIGNACNGSATVDQLARRFGIPREELRGLVAGLRILGLVQVEKNENESEIEEKTKEEAPTDRRVSEHGLRVIRARVTDKMAQVQEGSYFAILEISPKASGYEIRKAYRSLIGQFALERFQVPELADLQVQVELVHKIIDEAYEVLRNPSLREAYSQVAQEEI